MNPCSTRQHYHHNAPQTRWLVIDLRDNPRDNESGVVTVAALDHETGQTEAGENDEP
jgi:hypothetical protein